ncbi:tyrosine-protein kinase [Levilactobacillus koreensis JCM 16448]|uniref:non-specific protein-tyrosine kinase n=1 Tax=Levilactobacillus koreensis TaxID=637971 RepID=A0AAC8ZH23_9LACO|nr:CpsD/CapB family tyrosine-protein kinase [Levilactobacillus koreensis]AKP65337.1 exopolysaccharide biosynthesis protein [Levilactobacillus koreensis]KRK86078.1 tyrosine-protein kinase [Levilactobacillus koreensis JCM 16448]
MSLFNRKKKLEDTSLKYGVGLVTYTDPSGMIAEQFKTIRTNIQFSSVDSDLKSILFTSSEPSEGKSTVSNNMAVTWADQGNRVILVDSDLRRPTIHRTFDVSNRKGLTNYLSGNASLDEIIQPTMVQNLYVITSGPVPPNPAELLGSSRINTLIKELTDKYDLLILDAPPVNTVTDSQLLAARVDGTILVVPQGIADKNGVRRAKKMLETVHANILGAVMNRVTAQKSEGYYGGSYYGGGYYGAEKTSKD